MNEGTDCLWSGGLNDEESNYYQFTLRRPDPKAALKDTQCSDMVNVSPNPILQLSSSSPWRHIADESDFA